MSAAPYYVETVRMALTLCSSLVLHGGRLPARGNHDNLEFTGTMAAWPQ
jgi:hypothetical protein